MVTHAERDNSKISSPANDFNEAETFVTHFPQIHASCTTFSVMKTAKASSSSFSSPTLREIHPNIKRELVMSSLRSQASLIYRYFDKDLVWLIFQSAEDEKYIERVGSIGTIDNPQHDRDAYPPSTPNAFEYVWTCIRKVIRLLPKHLDSKKSFLAFENERGDLDCYPDVTFQDIGMRLKDFAGGVWIVVFEWREVSATMRDEDERRGSLQAKSSEKEG